MPESGTAPSMTPTPYSFIDVAILDGVRERFAAGDAVVILSADLEELIWANGPGALLFGLADIEAVGGAESGLSYCRQAPDHVDQRLSQDRQRPRRGGAAGQGHREPGLRLSGKRNHAARRRGGDPACRAGGTSRRGARPRCSKAPSAALRNRAISRPSSMARARSRPPRRASPRSASPPRRWPTWLPTRSRSGRRLVKKIIPAQGASLPAGMARLRDTPARHLACGGRRTVDGAPARDLPRQPPSGRTATPGSRARDRRTSRCPLQADS